VNAIEEMRLAYQTLRDSAAYHARHARQSEQRLAVNNRIDCKDTLKRNAFASWQKYQANVRASIIVKNGLERAEMQERKANAVETLRAMS
jgi:hypothetical protein